MRTCLSGSMLAKPPLWLDWPPLEAISRTSSLGLVVVVLVLLVEVAGWGRERVPVGEVAGVGILGAGHGDFWVWL